MEELLSKPIVIIISNISVAGFQKKRITDLESGFQKDLDDLKAEFDKERYRIVAQINYW